MISLLFKHFVGEWCINHVFDTIKNNFSENPIIAVGNHFKEITIESGDRLDTYTDCKIVDVYTSRYLGQEITLFNFSTNSGDLIMGCDYFSMNFKR